ncbi:MAG TPA: hypothetical protein VGN95_13890 [Pyrinomonadaceae bacterium]|jgi:hypothetical protein|nr:hypothetical protein [Pyrinomonadaceae bacterium]
MIEVKRAVQLANEYLNNLLGEDAVSDVRLEEVELAEQGYLADEAPDEVRPEADAWDGTYWLITVSYLPKNPNPLIPEPLQRQYKVFKLRADSGDFVAMKMRKVA